MRNLFYCLFIISVFACCNNADKISNSTITKNESIINSNNVTIKNPTTVAATEQATDSILQYAYVKKIIKKTDSVFIVTDFIQYLTGAKAVAAAKKNGEADTAYNEKGKIISIYVAHDFYILNDSKKLRQLPLAKEVVFEILASTTLVKTTLENFIKKYPYDNFLFKLELKNGEVKKISQLYLP